jgi:hypothetical protein
VVVRPFTGKHFRSPVCLLASNCDIYIPGRLVLFFLYRTANLSFARHQTEGKNWLSISQHCWRDANLCNCYASGRIEWVWEHSCAASRMTIESRGETILFVQTFADAHIAKCKYAPRSRARGCQVKCHRPPPQRALLIPRIAPAEVYSLSLSTTHTIITIAKGARPRWN